MRILYDTCIKCGKRKPVSMFPRYKNRKGILLHNHKCKDCTNAYKHEHYLNNMQVYKDRAKKFHEDNHDEYIQYLRKYYRENKEELLEKAKIYVSSHREMSRDRCRRWRNNPANFIKNKAHSAVSHALRNGSLLRPTSCSICGRECKPEAHHEDYSKPLDVVWVCKQCHENTHHLNEGVSSLEETTNKTSNDTRTDKV